MTLVGWCPGGRPVADMLARYPGTQTVRIFVGARDPLPSWDGPILGPLVDVLPHLSFKRWDLPALTAWLDGMPDRPLILTYAHEPEQGTDAGDPPLEVWRTRWAELVAELADHPKRGLISLVPVYTRYWWQANAGDPRWLVAYPGVDAIGWDIYNSGASYRTPDDLLTVPRDIAKRTGLPYLIAELGAVRIPGDDDGAGRTAWMRAMVAAARADGAWTACWFHKDEWDLAGSAAEQQTLRELIQEASVDWHLAPSLKVLRDEINARWPNRDKTSDGSIGDAAHQAGTSDHNPNVRGSVDAIDIDKDGVDIPAIIAAVQAHPSAHYWIFERQIADRDDGWRRRPYDGPNPHDHHMHVSIRQTVTAEENTQPWGLLEDDDMSAAAEQQIANLYAAMFYGGPSTGRSVDPDGTGGKAASNSVVAKLDYLMQRLDALQTAVGKLPALVGAEGVNPAELTAALAGLPKPAPMDVDGLASALAPKLVASLPADSPITDGQMERVLRSVLGSLDADAPQAG